MDGNYLIVVGVDGSEGGRRALSWAVGEAASRGAAVEAVIAWTWDGVEAGPPLITSPEQARKRAAAILTDEIAAQRASTGSAVPIAAEVVEGDPVTVLTGAARNANALVLGSHGHGRIRHGVLGSVSEGCTRLATCPVVVIPTGTHTASDRATTVVRA